VNTTTEYFLGDALGSVRQLTDASGEITLAKSYAPYGETANSAGSAISPFAFTGEQQDVSGLTYLRARYYSSGDGHFLTRDTWMGDYNRPLSLNRWNYVSANPVNHSDPSGYCTGYKGIDPLINTAMSFTGPYIFDRDHWRATGDSWKESWNTCVESFQKASVEYQRGNYWRAYLYANGFSASMHQAGARVDQINRELDTIWCEDAPLGERIYAALDVGAWSIGIASFIAPFAYEGWLATKGLVSEAYLGSLGRFSYYDDMLNPTMRHSGHYAEPIDVQSAYVQRLINSYRFATAEEKIAIQHELNAISIQRATTSLNTLNINLKNLPSGNNCVGCLNNLLRSRGAPTLVDDNYGLISDLRLNYTELSPQSALQTGNVVSWSTPELNPLPGFTRLEFYRHVGMYLDEGFVFSKLGQTGPYTVLTLDELAFWYPRIPTRFWAFP